MLDLWSRGLILATRAPGPDTGPRLINGSPFNSTPEKSEEWSYAATHKIGVLAVPETGAIWALSAAGTPDAV